MKEVFFVKPDEFETALAMEKRLLALPEESGMLFVGVSVLPDPDPQRKKPLFRVVIGCTRDVETDLMHAAAKTFLRDFVEDERQIVVEAYRGTSRNPTGSAKASNLS